MDKFDEKSLGKDVIEMSLPEFKVYLDHIMQDNLKNDLRDSYIFIDIFKVLQNHFNMLDDLYVGKDLRRELQVVSSKILITGDSLATCGVHKLISRPMPKHKNHDFIFQILGLPANSSMKSKLENK